MRPKLPEDVRREHILRARVTREENRLLQHAAARRGITLAALIREAALNAAEAA